MRGRRRGSPDAGAFASVLEALYRPIGWDYGGSVGDELESLILAQNERWRHA
jgi:hypothetical protein